MSSVPVLTVVQWAGSLC